LRLNNKAFLTSIVLRFSCILAPNQAHMKKIVLAVFCVSTIILLSFRGDDNADKAFAKSVFECLKKNDLAGFKKLVVTATIFDSLANNNDTWTDEEKSRYKSKMTQHNLDSLISDTYNDVRTNYSVKWENVHLDSIQVKTEPMEGMEALSFQAFFTENKKQYILGGNTILKTSSGAWKIANKLRVEDAN